MQKEQPGARYPVRAAASQERPHSCRGYRRAHRQRLFGWCELSLADDADGAPGLSKRLRASASACANNAECRWVGVGDLMKHLVPSLFLRSNLLYTLPAAALGHTLTHLIYILFPTLLHLLPTLDAPSSPASFTWPGSPDLLPAAISTH